MLKAGNIDNETHARSFGDYLYAQGIENNIDEDEGLWEAWVIDGDQLSSAQTLLQEFLREPDDPKYEEASEQAKQKRNKEAKDLQRYKKQMHDRDSIFARWQFNLKSLTGALIIISVLVTILSNRGKNQEFSQPLSITKYSIEDGRVYWRKGLLEIQQGQVWRLITPIFLHLSILHILFNMMWLKDLGYAIESKHGALFLLVMVLMLGITSNVGQYLTGGPGFGGMSGVVYGLLGYIWIRARIDPRSGFQISNRTVTFMMIWFFLCFSGLLPIANTAHTVGLLVGMLWGFISARIAVMRQEEK